MSRTYRLGPAPTPRASLVDFERHLDAEQLAAARAPLGPVLVIAGAGSGKTRTLVFRLVHLLEQGIPPEGILLLTFTNRAAREMLDRAAELVGALPGIDPRRLQGGTFHRMGHRVLRRHAERLGFPPGFGILDTEDQRDLVAACIADLGLSVGRRRFPRADWVAALLSESVNTQRTLGELLAARYDRFADLEPELVRVAHRYRERKLAMGVMDFDDLLLHWQRLLAEHAEVRAELQARYEAILVDEYQDTNRIQADIVERLAGNRRNVTVVGDDAQSIYSFRGADLTNILEFPVRFSGCAIHRLTANHRSRPQILALANASIAHNTRQFPKDLRAMREDGPLPVLVPARDAVQQAAFVAQRILELRDEGFPLREIAVLYRAHHQSMELQIELARRGIPFHVRSGVRFFEQAHIKDVLCFLRLAHNPADELAFRRAVRLFSGIGAKTADRLWTAFSGAAGSAADRLGTLELPAIRSTAGYEAFRRLVAAVAELLAAPGTAIETVLSSMYEEHLRTSFLNADARVEDIRQLAAWAAQFPDANAFLAEVSLLSDLSAQDVVEAAEKDEFVTLSSIHRAKGLEWRAVFLIWLAEGHFPIPAATADPVEEEEERRCFYVAVTRARDELYLCHPILAAPRDGERILLRPSRFLQELDGERKGLWERWSLEEGSEEEAVAPPDREALRQAAGKLLEGD
ncbi:MAG TPA: ATP-dependent helicase [Fredinandcohnia sp.]|nr:ATP-dependent helicase [Fredinandcohnia sp.]